MLQVNANDEQQKTAFMFFATFSRLDFALLTAGLYKVRNKRPEANWSTFSSRLSKDFFKTAHNQRTNYIYNCPPQRPVVIEDAIQFRPLSEPIRNNSSLFNAIGQLRNNFFHGMKPELTKRDIRLFDCSLEIIDLSLSEAAKSSDKKMRLVYSYFHYVDVG